MVRILLCLLAVSLVVCGSVKSHLKASDESVEAATAAYEQETDTSESAFANEPPTATRVAKDAASLAEAAGEELSSKVSPLLIAMFDKDATDDERLAAVADLRSLLPQLKSGNVQQRSVARQLSRRLELAEVCLRGMKDGNANDEARELANELLVRAAVDFEGDGRSVHGNIVRENYRQLRQHHPAVFAPIERAFARDYFNYNLHFVLSEPMMSRLVSDYRTESGGVADCILGAWVTGCQVTDTSVRADIRPSMRNAAFDLVVDGQTSTNTTGRKSPATIYSLGNHNFNIRKPTFFDGQSISSSAAKMDVNINTRTTRVSTDYDRIPILGGIARKIAARKAAEQQPQANAIAARKMADKALPQFENEVSQKFSEANGNIQTNIMQNLRERGIEPTAYYARSSETHLAVSSRTISGDSLSAPRPPGTPAPRRGVAVQIHHSAINAAIDSLGITGQMTPNQVIDRIEASLEDLLNKDVSFDRSDVEDNTVFDFSQFDPIRVRFAENQVFVILRTGFIQTDRDRTVPKHNLEIPIGLELRNGKLMLIPPRTDTRSILELRPRSIEERASPRSVIQARAVAKELLEKTFRDPEVEIDTNLDLAMGDGSTTHLHITGFEITDGWLTVVME